MYDPTIIKDILTQEVVHNLRVHHSEINSFMKHSWIVPVFLILHKSVKFLSSNKQPTEQPGKMPFEGTNPGYKSSLQKSTFALKAWLSSRDDGPVQAG